MSAYRAKSSQCRPQRSPLLRTLQQAINHPLPSLRRFIAHERRHLLRSRRQPDQIKGHASNQSHPIRLRRRLQSRRLQLRQNKPIHLIPHPAHILHHRSSPRRERLKRPMFPSLIKARRSSSKRDREEAKTGEREMEARRVQERQPLRAKEPRRIWHSSSEFRDG